MVATKIAKAAAFPGCCGISSLKEINTKVDKKAFLAWLKNEDDSCGLGGLVTAVSKIDDKKMKKSLMDFGFKVLTKFKDEIVWYRRLRYSHSYW